MVSFRNLSGGIVLMALAMLSLVAVAAASLPAYRAASIHPMSCLRNQ
jgi:ABC-type lipoprotein release transport system permease subunit